MPRSLRVLAATFQMMTAILSPWTFGVFGATNPQTVCGTTQLDWYTNVVGETPCVTYQRLRQICNNDYQVGVFNTNTPGDSCNDQVSACCCNSISFALSMLCMNCQYDVLTSPNGIDAGNGAYGLYLDNCGPGSNQTLPSDIQAAVCNKDIKIENDLYGLFWNTGAWFYIYTKETMETTFSATNNNSFTHCNSTLVNSTQSATPTSSTQLTTSSPTTASTDTSIQTSAPPTAGVAASKSNVGPIVGGVVGGVLGAAAVGVLLFYLLRKKRQNNAQEEYHNEDVSRPFQSSPPVTSYTTGSVPTNPYLASLTVPSSSTSAPVPSSTATNSSYAYASTQHTMSSPVGVYGSESNRRHEDGGPVARFLQRSNSGRLPPAYQSQWQPSEAPESGSAVGYFSPSEIMQSEGSNSEVGGSRSGGGSTGGSVLGLPLVSRLTATIGAGVSGRCEEAASGASAGMTI